MSEQNGYIKDEDLPTLTTPELVQKIRTARKIWKDDQKTIESLTNQCAESASRIGELESLLHETGIGAEQTEAQIKQLECEAESQAETIQMQQANIAELEARVENYQSRLQEVGDHALEAWCKAGKAYAIVKPHHKVED